MHLNTFVFNLFYDRKWGDEQVVLLMVYDTLVHNSCDATQIHFNNKIWIKR